MFSNGQKIVLLKTVTIPNGENKPIQKVYSVKISLDVANKGFDIYKGHKIGEVDITAYDNTNDYPHNNSTSSLRLFDLTQDVNYVF